MRPHRAWLAGRGIFANQLASHVRTFLIRQPLPAPSHRGDHAAQPEAARSVHTDKLVAREVNRAASAAANTSEQQLADDLAQAREKWRR
jgi:hypothetical protein